MYKNAGAGATSGADAPGNDGAQASNGSGAGDKAKGDGVIDADFKEV
jgi:hypothetical protein